MEIPLTLLGGRYAAAIFQGRVLASASNTRRSSRIASTLASSGGPLGPIGQSWAHLSGLPEPAASEAIRAVRGQLGGLMGGIGGGWGFGFGMPAIAMAAQNQLVPALIFGAMATAGLTLGTLWPRWIVQRSARTPLQLAEIDELLEAVTDDLERSYLLLVREALQHTAPSEATAKEVCGAIQALGEALERLPAAPAPNATRDSASLHAEAVQLRAQAQTEADGVVADSLERRADALERSAAAIEKAGTLLRRNATLRQELATQTEALRIELTAASGQGTDVGSLAQLAQSAQGIGQEASALAAARAELDAASTPPLQQVGRTS